jgi:hypothetical protein
MLTTHLFDNFRDEGSLLCFFIETEAKEEMDYIIWTRNFASEVSAYDQT